MAHLSMDNHVLLLIIKLATSKTKSDRRISASFWLKWIHFVNRKPPTLNAYKAHFEGKYLKRGLRTTLRLDLNLVLFLVVMLKQSRYQCCQL